MSTEHCLACFEALVAHHEKREPLSLEEIQTSYARYSSSSSSSSSAHQSPALRRVADKTTTTSSSSSSSTSLAPSTAATSISSSSSSDLTTAPLFVTWNTLDPSEDDDPSLRGCIGTFEPLPLTTGIPEYALISALHDSRFPSISSRELPELEAAVTLLTDFEEVDDPRDWVVGVHGVRLSFRDKGRSYGATYLPDVASEQGWTRDEALFSLVRKAGWMGGRGRWEGLELRVTRYQGKKARASYADYKRWRDWADSQ